MSEDAQAEAAPPAQRKPLHQSMTRRISLQNWDYKTADVMEAFFGKDVRDEFSQRLVRARPAGSAAGSAS